MSHRSVPRMIILLLLAGVSILPATICVVLVLAALLGAMGDGAGAQVLVYVGWAIGVMWCVSLIGLVLALALQTLLEPEAPEQPPAGRKKEPLEEPDA